MKAPQQYGINVPLLQLFASCRNQAIQKSVRTIFSPLPPQVNSHHAGLIALLVNFLCAWYLSAFSSHITLCFEASLFSTVHYYTIFHLCWSIVTIPIYQFLHNSNLSMPTTSTIELSQNKFGHPPVQSYFACSCYWRIYKVNAPGRWHLREDTSRWFYSNWRGSESNNFRSSSDHDKGGCERFSKFTSASKVS